MDQQGVWAQIMYPNTVGFGGQQLGKSRIRSQVRGLTA